MLSASTSDRNVPKFLQLTDAIAWNLSPEWCLVLFNFISAVMVSVLSLSSTSPIYFFSGSKRLVKYALSSSKSVTSPAWKLKIILLMG